MGGDAGERKVSEVKRAVRENTWKERSSEGLLELDINPIGELYLGGARGRELGERKGEKESVEGGGITSVNHFNDTSPLH